MFKILQVRFHSTWTLNFQMFKLDLEKAEEPETKLPTSPGSSEKQESPRKNISAQFSSVTQSFWVSYSLQLWTAACKASLSTTNSQNLLKLMSIESVIPSNHIILCCPLLLLPSIFPSIRIFSNESVLHIKWSKYWSFSFSISPSNDYSGLISFRMDWLDLLAVQGTLKSLLRHHSLKASILRHSAFFIVQLPHPYMATGKNHSFYYTDIC